jgi:hypothetical protein
LAQDRRSGRQELIVGKIGTALTALTLAFGLTASAKAATVILDVGAMDHPRVVNIAGIGNVYSAPMEFKTIYDGKSENLLAWCVDVYHEITLKDYSPNLVYVDSNKLTTDFGGHALDPGDTGKVGLLVNYGQYLFDDVPTAPPPFTEKEPKRSDFPAGKAGTAAYNAAHAAFVADKAAHNAAVTAYNAAVADRFMRLDAVQSAIWQVVSNRDVTSSDKAFDLLVDHLSANPTAWFGPGYTADDYGFKLITPVQQYGGRGGKTPLPLTQSFVFATGPVPEPATWALTIAGLGLAGAALRRRRSAAPAV